MEHKGWDASFGFWVVFWFVLVVVRSGCVSVTVHPVWDASPILRFPASQTASAIPLQIERRPRMAQRAIRFSEATDKGIQEAARKRGFSSPTAFIRHSVEQELSGRSEELVGAEERLAASIEQIRREVFRLGRAQQALFAFVDSLAKVLLTCVPEPGGEAMEAAVAQGARPARPVVEECGPSDGRRLAGGDAGFGEPWRRMTKSEFRLRPRKPPARNERAAWASAYKILMHHARMSGSRKRRSVGVRREADSDLQPTMCGTGHVREEHRCRTVASPWALRRP